MKVSKRLRSAMLVLALGMGIITACAAWWIKVYDNYHVVLPGELYRAGQMTTNRLAFHVEQDQLKTVINLRTQTNTAWYAEERDFCKKANITHIDFPMAGFAQTETSELQKLVNIMRTAEHPILVHCRHGADRTGLAIALYLRELKKVPLTDAKKALAIRYGHLPLPITRHFDDAFIEFHSTE